MALLTIFKGETTVFVLSVKDAAGAPRDITGAALEFTIGTIYTPPAVIIEKSVGSGIVLRTQSGATLGQADITIAAGDLVGVNDKVAGIYTHCVKMVLGGVTTFVVQPEPGNTVLVDSPNP